jgi:hypothetical protein
MENFGYIAGSPPPFIIMAFGLAGFYGSLGAWWQINLLPGELFYRRITRYLFLISNLVWLSLLLLPIVRIILIGNLREGVVTNHNETKVLLLTIDTGIIIFICLAITCICFLYTIAYTATRQYKGVMTLQNNGGQN